MQRNIEFDYYYVHYSHILKGDVFAKVLRFSYIFTIQMTLIWISVYAIEVILKKSLFERH
jgi:hypothetical protein